jgi:hypothetical protein
VYSPPHSSILLPLVHSLAAQLPCPWSSEHSQAAAAGNEGWRDQNEAGQQMHPSSHNVGPTCFVNPAQYWKGKLVCQPKYDYEGIMEKALCQAIQMSAGPVLSAANMLIKSEPWRYEPLHVIIMHWDKALWALYLGCLQLDSEPLNLVVLPFQARMDLHKLRAHLRITNKKEKLKYGC